MKKKTYPTTNGNLAFDLDVLVRERELETAGEHNRRQEEVRRAEAQPKPRTRPQARPRQRVSPVLLAGTMVLAALAVVLVMGYVQLTTISGSVSEMKNELTQLNTEHVALLTRYEQTYDLASVKEAARSPTSISAAPTAPRSTAPARTASSAKSRTPWTDGCRRRWNISAEPGHIVG